ncbi:MAG TPA: ABC transporter permease, partial [Candidatus Wirthbacteria bacterium]|nr:ABC transporter permease [Candidatus Wirthbacteria bacterium]
LWPLQKTLGQLPKLRATIKMIVTYPLSSRFRTGMTLAMYSLIIFTVVVISVLKHVQQNTIQIAVAEQTGGFDFVLRTNPSTPLTDLSQAINDNPNLNSSDFASVSQMTHVGAIFNLDKHDLTESSLSAMPNQEDMPVEMLGLSFTGVDEQFTSTAQMKIDVMADQFSDEQEVWQALSTNPEYAIIDSRFVGNARTRMLGFPTLTIGDTLYFCSALDNALCGQREIIGVLAGATFGVYTAKEGLIADLALNPNHLMQVYRIALAPNVDKTAMSNTLEKAFVKNGVQVIDLESQIREVLALLETFMTLMQGFLAMGLIAGIAGLSIIMIRSVHERRQQIGVLRAIGFKRRQILQSFLGETTLISLLGILIGSTLGIIISYFLFQEEISQMAGNATFVIPWLELFIIVSLAYVFSLLGTIWPALKAAHLTPAEVLRYEG